MLEALLIICIVLNIMQFAVSVVLSGIIYLVFLEKKLVKEQPPVKSVSVDRIQSDQAVISNPANSFGTSRHPSNSYKIEDLPPDVIAPFLRKPPKPAGGFGSKVE